MPQRPDSRTLSRLFVTTKPATAPARYTSGLSLAAGAVSAGRTRRQGQAAPRWPPASPDSSSAPRMRQLREEQGENRPTINHRISEPALRLSKSTLYSQVIRTDTAGGNH